MTTSTINNFIYETVLINPISDIVNKLENREFRDCDVKWLNSKLDKFTSFALETLGKSFDLNGIGSDMMNDNVREQFLNHFNTLLKYFKNFK